MVMCLQSMKFTDYLLDLLLTLSTLQKEAYEKIASYKQSCYLTGLAGSGKSHLLKCLHSTLISFNDYPGVVSNVAATDINGVTLSKFVQILDHFCKIPKGGQDSGQAAPRSNKNSNSNNSTITLQIKIPGTYYKLR